MATEAERNARLDELVKATKAWASSKTKELKNQSAFAKRVLKGRTGSEGLNNTTVVSASKLLVDEIEAFLAG